MRKNEIKIEEENSKFGTFILMQKNRIEIIKGKPLYKQISNIHLIIQYKKSSSLLSFYNAEVVEDKNTYKKIITKLLRKKTLLMS